LQRGVSSLRQPLAALQQREPMHRAGTFHHVISQSKHQYMTAM
jgi:hypothetical protein